MTVQQSVANNGGHIGALDGIRGAAAYIVVLSHFSNSTDLLGRLLGNGAGKVGVMVFFVLSGYLMGRLYFPQRPTPRSIASFFVNRFARVVPLYAILVAASFILTSFTASSWPLYPVTSENLHRHLLFLHGVSVLWTIPVEVQFYVAFPIFWLAFALLGRWLGAAAIASLIIVDVLAGQPWSPLLLRHLPFFLLGVLAALLPRFQRDLSIPFLALVGVFFLTLPQVRLTLGLGRDEDVWHSLVHMSVIPALIVCAANSSLAAKVLGGAAGRFTGQISYSVYLWHLPIMLVLAATPISDNVVVFLAVHLIATSGLAWLSYRWIEAPCRAWLRTLGDRLVRQTSSAASEAPLTSEPARDPTLPSPPPTPR